MSRFLVVALAVFLLGGCDQMGNLVALGSNDRTERTGKISDEQTVRLVTATNTYEIQVEIADDPEERSRGLMFRRELADDAGMLFDFKTPRQVSFWMKNTYIPLDMLFIRSDGTIARIAENTEPHSLEGIPSGEPVLAVLELKGGTSKALGIRAGDRVQHPIFARP